MQSNKRPRDDAAVVVAADARKRPRTCLQLCAWSGGIARRDAEKHARAHLRDSIVPERIDYYAAAAGGSASSSRSAVDARLASGDQRLKALIKALARLDELGYRRSRGQLVFHKAFVAACLKKIYGEDLYRNVARLMREYELDELRSDVIVCAPRRFGKTMGVAMFVAAYLLTQPSAEISIFSTGRRASKKILALICQMVVRLAGTTSVIQTYNLEELHVRGPGDVASRCLSYPSRQQIDECGFRPVGGGARTHIDATILLHTHTNPLGPAAAATTTTMARNAQVRTLRVCFARVDHVDFGVQPNDADVLDRHAVV